MHSICRRPHFKGFKRGNTEKESRGELQKRNLKVKSRREVQSSMNVWRKQTDQIDKKYKLNCVLRERKENRVEKKKK